MSAMENAMGTKPIRPLLIKACLPLMLGLLMNNLYHFVDSMYVSRLGEAELSALSLAAPIMTLLAALGSGIAIGLNAVVSKALGEKNEKDVQRAIRTALFMAAVAYGITALGGIFLIRPYFLTQTDTPEIVESGVAYLGTYMVLACGLMFQWVFDRLLISTGKTHFFLVTLSTAAVINIILDPIFIFGHMGIPAMGIRGAAIATAIGQLAGALLGLALNLRHNEALKMKLSFVPHFATLKRILAIGVPTALIQGFNSIMAMAINLVLISFSATAVALYGILLRILNMVQMIPNGIALGVIPIVAYNYGAKNRQRIEDTIKYSLRYALAGCLAGMALLMIIPGAVIGLFNPTDAMAGMAMPAIRTMSVTLPLASVSIIMASVFQGFGRAKYSMYLSLARQIIILLPAIYLISLTRAINLVWAAFPLTEAVALLAAAALYRMLKQNVMNQI